MTASEFSGPIIVSGNMQDALFGNVQNTNPVAGPSIFYHGQGFPDVRYYPLPKDQLDNPGVVFSSFSATSIIALNAVPSTAGGASSPIGNLASAQPAINGTALTLATNSSVGVTLNFPYNVFGTSTIATGIGLDVGIETPTVTASSKTVTVADSSIYRSGQPIIITNCANTAGTTHLFTYITGLPTATTITIADAPLASNSLTSRICSGLPGWANANGATPAIRPTFAAPYIAGGAALIFDPTQAVERGVSIVGTVLATGGSFTIKGADIYGQPQSEVLTIASGATTGNSKKTYKVITSVTPSFADSTHTYTVNTTDLFGLPLRSDFWEMLDIFVAGSFVTSSTGWTKGDKTSPATTSTGDPRGTYLLQSPSNGVNRVVMFQTLPFLNLGRGSPTNPQFLYGVTPV